MHGRCWSQRALAFLQLEQARMTRLPPLAASLSSLLEPVLPLSSPLVASDAKAVGSAESEADSDGDDDAVSDGDDCGDDARLDASVLPTGGEGEVWRAALGGLAMGDEDVEDEAEKANEADEEADGETAVDAAIEAGRLAIGTSECSCSCGCEPPSSGLGSSIRESGRTQRAAVTAAE